MGVVEALSRGTPLPQRYGIGLVPVAKPTCSGVWGLDGPDTAFSRRDSPVNDDAGRRQVEYCLMPEPCVFGVAR